MNVLASFLLIQQARVLLEGETPIEKMPPSEWPTGKSMGIFLINDWYGNV